MTFKPLRYLVALMLSALVLLMSGCVTPMPSGDAAYLHVAENGVMTLWGDPVLPGQLAKRLKQGGVSPTNTIKIVPHGNVPKNQLQSVAGYLGRAGMRKVVIMEPPKVITIVGGKTSEVEVGDD